MVVVFMVTQLLMECVQNVLKIRYGGNNHHLPQVLQVQVQVLYSQTLQVNFAQAFGYMYLFVLTFQWGGTCIKLHVLSTLYADKGWTIWLGIGGGQDFLCMIFFPPSIHCQIFLFDLYFHKLTELSNIFGFKNQIGRL